MTAWSYSSLTAFETCPRRYKLTKVTKEITEPQTEATLHGNAVHKAIEESITKGKAMPDKYKQHRPLVDTVLAAPGVKHAEMKFALTKDLTPTTFFGKDVWLRGVFDLVVDKIDNAVIVDWKTGKPKPDSDQLKLFAAAAFSLMPRLKTVRTGFAWLAHNRLDSETFEKDEAPAIWGEFKPRVQRIQIAVQTDGFPPQPSGLCKNWCPVPRTKCEFSGRPD